jgi:hypothetical protein
MNTNQDSFSTSKIENVKIGDLFKLKENGTVYVRDSYNQFTKKYSSHRFDDISRFKELKKGTVVLVDFTF